jgi:ubiquinone/menaquinone biosynthesis C-methylase UbiE
VKYDLDQIRAFWTEQARQHGQSPSASWSDHHVIDLEIRELLTHMKDGDRVLDVGCANGYTTIQLASQKKLSMRGIDYIPEMIEEANSRLATMSDNLLGSVEFAVGDGTNIDADDATFDKAIVVRVIINLRTQERQAGGLRECARVLKPGGLLCLSEATVQGWQRLNDLRSEWGFPPIPMPAFNQYLDETHVVDVLGTDMELVAIRDFASTYYVGTRLVKPILARALGADIDIANPHTHTNRFFAQLPAWGDYGTQKLFVFRKC